jgi:hypothetical protein
MSALVYWRQINLLNAVGAFVLWLERHGSLDATKRFSEWKNKRSAYPLAQLLAGKMSKDEALRYCCAEQLGWAKKETESLIRARIKVIADKQSSKAQAQFEMEISTAWRRALASNID